LPITSESTLLWGFYIYIATSRQLYFLNIMQYKADITTPALNRIWVDSIADAAYIPVQRLNSVAPTKKSIKYAMPDSMVE